MKDSDKIFQVDKDDIGKELRENNYLKDWDVDVVDGKEKTRNTKRFSFNGTRPRGWHIFRRFIGIPDATPASQVPIIDMAKTAWMYFDNIGCKDKNTQPTLKQYRMVISNIIDASRPGIAKADKNRIWGELEPLVELVCMGRGWTIHEKANVVEKAEAEKDAAEYKKNQQNTLSGCPPAGNQANGGFDLTAM